MSDERLDALAETARNRGLKLVRSRIRTPGKRRFGKVGLTDAKGKAVFGMDAKGPKETPEKVENYLRGLGASDWGASLRTAGAPATRRRQTPLKAANDAPRPAPRRKMKAELNPSVREGKPGDAGAIVELNALLGAATGAAGVRKRLRLLAAAGTPVLVATLGKDVVGLCGISEMIAVHRDAPVGRIHHIVVADAARGRGIGRMLVEQALARLAKRGCGLVEVTSNDRLAAAHAFWRHMGFERTSIRFAKEL